MLYCFAINRYALLNLPFTLTEPFKKQKRKRNQAYLNHSKYFHKCSHIILIKNQFTDLYKSKRMHFRDYNKDQATGSVL